MKPPSPTNLLSILWSPLTEFSVISKDGVVLGIVAGWPPVRRICGGAEILEACPLCIEIQLRRDQWQRSHDSCKGTAHLAVSQKVRLDGQVETMTRHSDLTQLGRWHFLLQLLHLLGRTNSWEKLSRPKENPLSHPCGPEQCRILSYFQSFTAIHSLRQSGSALFSIFEDEDTEARDGKPLANEQSMFSPETRKNTCKVEDLQRLILKSYSGAIVRVKYESRTSIFAWHFSVTSSYCGAGHREKTSEMRRHCH